MLPYATFAYPLGNRRPIVKVINELLFHEKTNAAVDQLRTFWEYGQLHSAVFLPKFTTVLFTIYLSCSNLLSDSYINESGSQKL